MVTRYLITYNNYDIEEEFEDLDLLIKHLIEIFKENGYFISRSLNNNQIIKLYEQEFDCNIHSYEKLEE